ncbi:MAG: hypothetical protein EOP84_34640, partial [Verrucomicrobiaceae bacterium]
MYPRKVIYCLAASIALALPQLVLAEQPTLPGVGAAMEQMVAKKEIAGAVTVVVSKDKVLHLECTGFANVEEKKPMK